ncbi:sugar transferase [uncultured Faecalicoccus sp.]|uniref:sugar transferase n=1 Tax=uncultured Faecalicoccus sp. TaxID=1971760 RepID=UPI0025D991BC|nr:sugar transferase [uncultured Faecalicoccus sp.]
MKNVPRSYLTKDMRWKLAEKLAKDRLPEINKTLKEVRPKDSFYSNYGKRILDILFSFLALIITFPINLVIGIVTFFDVGRPIFFKQNRIGKNGEAFEIIKFRNMNNNIDKNGDLLPASERVTKWGKVVRKTSLDELLNFWAVFKGDMSLIGPRPLPEEYVIRYNARHIHRLDVKPGLECPPRYKIDNKWNWQNQFENDVWYVENVSFFVDCLMCIKLIQYALDRKSSNMRSNATRGIFMGYSLEGVAIDLDGVPQNYIDEIYNSSEGQK